ncbi:hypothetical protein A2U01_0119454, partial [Trifolium medium]|nr:hypothetical protein [Trifolium medium]
KDFVENPEFEAFKAEVKEELSAQKMDIQELMKNQKSMYVFGSAAEVIDFDRIEFDRSDFG